MTQASAALGRYFTSEQIDRFEISGDRAALGGVEFSMSGGILTLTKAPDDAWVQQTIANEDAGQAMWTVAAWLKVRVLDNKDGIVYRARSGDLYDEDYYTRRGGGSPYVGYPLQSNGHDTTTSFDGLADEIVSAFHPQAVLDLGCATGVLVGALQRRGVAAQGIDISEWATKNAITHGVHHGTATALPFADATFDVTISQDFMEHIHPDELPQVLLEQVRVLKPGGRLVHFIPFEPYDAPVQIDAHLCNVNRAWWLTEFAAAGLTVVQLAPDEHQWGAGPQLARYFILVPAR